MEKSEYIKQIIRFNADKGVIRLKERYNETSFFEIIAKERSETTYSAFLKWLLQGSAVGTEELSPLMMLMDILVKKTEDNPCKDTEVSQELKNSILTRSLVLNNISSNVEKTVGSLANEINGGNSVCCAEDLRKIAAKSVDRIDIFLQCDVSSSAMKGRPMQIILENKIDSREGKEKRKGENKNNTGVFLYDKKASQTERYYMATQRNDVYQWYVYLTPDAVDEGPTDPHFIHITYQDIVDGIIAPLLASTSLSSRTRFFLEEFRNQLTYPSLNGTSVQPSIAISNEQMGELTDIWKEYKDLITDAALAASETTFWKVGEKWYNKQPRLELALILQDQNIPEAANFLTTDQKGENKVAKNTRFSDMAKVAEAHGIKTLTSEKDFDQSQDLLAAFWDKNRRFLTALLSGIEESDNVLALTQEVAKRDTTRYTVFYDGQKLSTEAMTKGKTAWVLITKWAQLYKESGKKLNLETLRKTFPRECNPYYEQGKWYKHLFYPKNGCVYDGKKGDGSVPTSHWDIDFNGKYDIQTDGGPVTFLKMWRKDALESFIEKATAMAIFQGKLSVISE